MTCLRIGALIWAVVLPLAAGTLDVSGAETVAVQSGGVVSFEVFTWSYGQNAQAFGLPPDPTDFNFVWITAPGTAGQFSATLRSADASTEVALDEPLNFADGYYSGVGYQGAVSTLQGHLHLSSASDSQKLFAAGSVFLRLENTGDDLTLGLSPLLLSQDLLVGLSGGPLCVGALPGAVTLENPAKLKPLFFSARSFAVVNPVPEPDSAWLLMGGGALLCALSTAWKRVSRSRR